MFDPNKLSYPRVEDGVVLRGPEDWSPAKVAALQRLSGAEPPAEAETDAAAPVAEPPKPRRGRPRKAKAG